MHLQLKKRLQEFEARWFFQQLIIGLDYCHKVSHAFKWSLSLACAIMHGHCCSNTASLEAASPGSPFPVKFGIDAHS